MVLNDLTELFEGCSSWHSDVSKAIDEFDTEDANILLQSLQEVSALLKKAENCADAKELFAVLESLNAPFISETTAEASK